MLNPITIADETQRLIMFGAGLRLVVDVVDSEYPPGSKVITVAIDGEPDRWSKRRQATILANVRHEMKDGDPFVRGATIAVNTLEGLLTAAKALQEGR